MIGGKSYAFCCRRNHRSSAFIRTSTHVVALLSLPISFFFAASSLRAQNPSTVGQFSPVMTWPYMAVHAHVLPTGKALWWPPFDDGDNPTLWDPSTNTNTPATHAGANIFCSGHAFLANGQLFVAGGHVNNFVGLPNTYTYNPLNDTWTRLPDMNAGRWYPTVTSLPNGDVLVLSGEITLQTGNNPLPQVWEASSGRWRNLTSASKSIPLYPWVFVAPSGKVFVAGPSSRSRFLTTSGTGAWTDGPAANFSPERTYGSAVMYEPGKILIAGGAPLDSVPTDTMEVIDLS